MHGVVIACGAGPQEHLGRRIDVQVVGSTCDVGLVAVGGELEGRGNGFVGSWDTGRWVPSVWFEFCKFDYE